MKTEFLKGLGLEQDIIDKIMAQNGKDIENQKKLTEAAEADRDALKTQLDDVAAKLKAFDGVDVAAMKAQIETLTADISAKETAFQAQLADRDFDALLDGVINDAKGKNAKLIRAALDIDNIKTSKNQKEDAAAAIKALRESDAYLFEEAKATETTPAKVSTGGEHTEPNGTGPDPFVAAAMKGAGLQGKEG